LADPKERRAAQRELRVVRALRTRLFHPLSPDSLEEMIPHLPPARLIKSRYDLQQTLLWN
jgi:hypothetical protein